ncbi:hypothetical protein BASA60_011144 [Batrachochytrium salamandrivorans]|nr:hypothetical protein BASA60_011144 [Batrachochytrium salamandrivorans]
MDLADLDTTLQVCAVSTLVPTQCQQGDTVGPEPRTWSLHSSTSNTNTHTPNSTQQQHSRPVWTAGTRTTPPLIKCNHTPIEPPPLVMNTTMSRTHHVELLGKPQLGEHLHTSCFTITATLESALQRVTVCASYVHAVPPRTSISHPSTYRRIL